METERRLELLKIKRGKDLRWGSCSICDSLSYLTAGKYFLCTDDFCKHKDYPKAGEIKKTILEKQGGLF